MDTAKFIKEWKSSPVIKYKLINELAEGLDEISVQQLCDIGMPQTAEPWLNFMEFLKVDEEVSAVMNSLNFYPIGYLANGDIICVEKPSGRVMISDHEEPSYTWILNSSLCKLLESISAFESFTNDLNHENPNYSNDFKIPDGMLDKLANAFKDIDSSSYEQQGYWYTEICALSD